MKDGLYVGADGRTYRWVMVNGEWTHTAFGEGWSTIAPADWPAAKVALDALIEEEAGEWVEWTPDGNAYPRRIRANGEGPCQYQSQIGKWYEAGSGHHEVAAYRKGREVALEQVRELVKLASEPWEANVMREYVSDRPGHSERTRLEIPDAELDAWLDWTQAVKDAAKKVKL